MSQAAAPPELPTELKIPLARGTARAGLTLRNDADLPLVARLGASSPGIRIAPAALGLAAGERQTILVEIDPGAGAGTTLRVGWVRPEMDGEEQQHAVTLRPVPSSGDDGQDSKESEADADSAPVSVLALFDETQSAGEGEWRVRDASCGASRARHLHRVTFCAGSVERATALLAVEDPSVMRVRKWLQAEDGLYLVTDEPAGEPLASWASRTREDLTPASLAELGCDLAVALAMLHAAGVAHGALSPTSVFRTVGGRLQLGGLTLDPAATLDGDTRDAAALLLTLVPHEAWWAPDAARAFRDVNSAAALYQAIEALAQAARTRPGATSWDATAPPERDLTAELDDEEVATLAAGYASAPSPGTEALHTSDVVIGAHETAEAEASPELELDARIAHVATDREAAPD